ncbi:MAG: TMEM43 family protein, partial [Planctomycetota bacterium]
MVKFGARSKNPIVGALFGMLMVPGSIALQAWNEYRTIHRTRGLNEASEIVETIEDTSQVNPSFDGQLVHMTGEAQANGSLRDPIFGVESNAIRLQRNVEMYQWDEKKESKENNEPTYSYRQVWSNGRINSSEFKYPSGHENPQARFDSWDAVAPHVHVGVFELNESLKRQKGDFARMEIDLESIRKQFEDDSLPPLSMRDGYVYCAFDAD